MIPVKLYAFPVKLCTVPSKEVRTSRQIQTPKRPRIHRSAEKVLHNKTARILNLDSTQRLRKVSRPRTRPARKVSVSSLKPRPPRSCASTHHFTDSLCGRKLGLEKQSSALIPSNHSLNVRCGSFLKQRHEHSEKLSCASQPDLSNEPGDRYHSISVKLTVKSRGFLSLQQHSHSAQTD